MLANSVIIVLREVIEAALLVGLLVGFSRPHKSTLSWLAWGSLLGCLFASGYAYHIDVVSDWFDGVGQEVVNGTLLIIVYLLLLLVSSIASFKSESKLLHHLPLFMSTVIALIMAHEGSELSLYWLSVFYHPEQVVGVLIGSAIGIGIGFSVGALFYFLVIVKLADRAIFYLQGLLALVGAGLSLQATQFFIQADIFPDGQPLWDTGEWLPETSLLGQLSYSLLGYEATPSTLQMMVYVVGMTIMVCLPRYIGKKYD